MSRVSRKSELSPSVTRSNNGIDLGKNSGIDLGKKSQPSLTSGGIGITQDVTKVGGLSVKGGVEVDLTPVDFGIQIDPAERTVSVSGGAEVPGGLIGISGGIEVDLNTGEIIGGSLGGEIGGFGINVSNSKKGGIGIEFTYQIPGTPIELSLGFGFPLPPKKPSPSPSPSPTTPKVPPPSSEKKWTPPGGISIEAVRGCTLRIYWDEEHIRLDPYSSGCKTWWVGNPPVDSPPEWGVQERTCEEEIWEIPRLWAMWQILATTKNRAYTDLIIEKHFNQDLLNQWLVFIYFYKIPSSFSNHYYREEYGADPERRRVVVDARIVSEPSMMVLNCLTEKEPRDIYIPPPKPEISLPKPFPNPPPIKRNMNECCRESIKLQRLIVRHLGAARSSTQETLPEGVVGVGSTQDGIRQAFPFVVKKRWVDPNAKDNEGIPILNDRQLALVLGGMIERLERVLGTAEFYKDSDKKLRQSEGNMLSWLTGKNKDFRYPDPNDFWLNTDDGIINEKSLEVRSIADGLRYQIEALNRLERILPIAELKDSSIPARWIYPNGKGQLRVGNLIHLCEYMIRKSDKDMGYWPQKITIKKANPAIENDEPITADVYSQADMLRVILQRIIDIQGDGDGNVGSNYDLRRTFLDVMAFQLTAKNNKYLQAITEYLSFDMTEEVSKIPIPFDVFAGQDRSTIEDWWIKLGFGEETLNLPTAKTKEEIEQVSEGLLQNSELEINTIKFGSLDERKDPKTLKETLIEILKHSSAASAAVTEVASEGALERVVDAASLAQKLTSFLMRRDIREGLGIGDLDKWISSAETGYTDNLETESLRFPESNPFEPYGRPATQNPVIREIDTKEDKAD